MHFLFSLPHRLGKLIYVVLLFSSWPLTGSHVVDVQQYSQDLWTTAVFINVWEIRVTKWEEMSRKFKMFLTDWWGWQETIAWRWGIYTCISQSCCPSVWPRQENWGWGWTEEHFGMICGRKLRGQWKYQLVVKTRNRCTWGRECTYRCLKGFNSSFIEVPLRTERETDAISIFRSAWRGLLAPADAGSLHHHCLSGWLPTTESQSQRVRAPARGSTEGRLPPATTTANCT